MPLYRFAPTAEKLGMMSIGEKISVIKIIGLILVTMVSKFAIGLSNVLIVPYDIKSPTSQ